MFLIIVFSLLIPILLFRKKIHYLFIYQILSILLILGAACHPVELSARDVFYYYDEYIQIANEDVNDIFIKERFYRGMFHGDWEFGYIVLNKILSIIFGDVDIGLFIGIFAILILTPMIIFIWNNSSFPFFSLILYIALGGVESVLSGFRQEIAHLILLFSFSKIENEKRFQTIIIIVIASLFHRSAIIMLVFYLFYMIVSKYKVTVKLLIIVFGIGICLYENLHYIYSCVFLFARIQYELKEVTNYWHLIVVWAVLAFSLIFDKSINDNKRKRFYYSMLMFSGIIQIVVLGGGQLARFNKYFVLPLCFILPDAVYAFLARQKTGKNLFIILLYLCITILFYATFSSYYGRYYNLESFY